MLKLRDYQTNLVQQIRGSFLQGKRAPLCVLPTGGGKTVIFSHVAATTAARGKRVMVLVHRIELLRQTSAALTKSGVTHGLLNPMYTPEYGAPVQVASVQTVVRRLDKFANMQPDLIIIDEAHHATAGTWRKILQAFPRAYTLGVTATPVRADGSGLGTDAGGVFDDLLTGPQVQELIDMGFLVKPLIYAPTERIDLRGVRTVLGDYNKQDIEEKVDKPQITGHAVDHYRRICPNTPAVAFCISVAHAEHVAEEFRAAGFKAYAVDGSMDDDVRKRILGGLASGHVDVVTSCDLISEGTDIPAIGCAILLRPTQSMGLYIQQVGRALRPCEGKERAVILDHVGNVITHGLPEEPREWTLDGEEKRKRKKKDDEPTVRVKQCEQCFAVHVPAPCCPECGFVYVTQGREIETVEGELGELTPEMRLALKRKKNKEVAEAQTYDDFKRIAAERGYKPGWAGYQYAKRKRENEDQELYLQAVINAGR